jgi:hypothetical protein
LSSKKHYSLKLKFSASRTSLYYQVCQCLFTFEVEVVPSPWVKEDPGIRNASSRLQIQATTYDEDWLCVEQDEMINPEHEELSHQVSKLCSSSGGCEVPRAHRLTVKTGYDRSLADKEPDPEKWIAKVLTHTQAYMYHPSLPTQITLEVNATKENLNVLSIKWRL